MWGGGSHVHTGSVARALTPDSSPPPPRRPGGPLALAAVLHVAELLQVPAASLERAWTMQGLRTGRDVVDRFMSLSLVRPRACTCRSGHLARSGPLNLRRHAGGGGVMRHAERGDA